jgi:hypothetical protein
MTSGAEVRTNPDADAGLRRLPNGKNADAGIIFSQAFFYDFLSSFMTQVYGLCISFHHVQVVSLAMFILSFFNAGLSGIDPVSFSTVPE